MNEKEMAAAKKQRQRLELQAAKGVVPWTQLNPKDYNFRSWAARGSKELLRAGCVYEYVRESRKLRCLLVLINSAFQKASRQRKRGADHLYRVYSSSRGLSNGCAGKTRFSSSAAGLLAEKIH